MFVTSHIIPVNTWPVKITTNYCIQLTFCSHDIVQSVRIFLGVIRKSQSDNLLKCVSLGGLAPVTVSRHRSLNTCKGVIRNWELANCDPEEVKRNIPNIVDIHRIVLKRDGKEIKTL